MIAPSPAMAILHRELLVNLRTLKPFVCMVLLVLLMALIFLFSLENVLGNRQVATGQVNTRDIQTLFMMFTFAFYGGAVVLVPTMAAVSICTEKQLGTFDQLKTTYIGPGALLGAKLGNVLGIYGLVLAATMPIMGVAFFAVGIDWSQFVLAMVLIALYTVSCAAPGMLFSAWCRRPAPAIVLTYLTTFTIQFGLMMVLVTLGNTVFEGTWLFRAVRDPSNNPLMAALYPLLSLAEVWKGQLSIVDLLFVIATHGLVIFVSLRVAARILVRPEQPPRINTERPIDDPAVLDARRKRFPYYLLDPRRRRPLIPDGKNPVYVREMQASFAAWGVWPIRIAYLFGIVCFLLSIRSSLVAFDQPRFVRPVYSSVLIGTIFTLFFVPAAVALPMAREHESGNMDMLRATLLRSRDVFRGKVHAALAAIAPMIAGILFGAIPLLLLGNDRTVGDLVALLVTILYTMALVTLFTANARYTAGALLVGYGVALAAHGALPYFSLYVIEFVSPRFFNFGTDDATVATYLSPLWKRINLNQFERFTNWSASSVIWPAYVTWSLLITGILFHFAARRFHTMYHRS